MTAFGLTAFACSLGACHASRCGHARRELVLGTAGAVSLLIASLIQFAGG
jgi:hypothetical protein